MDSTVGIPAEWRLPLAMALLERAGGASQFTTSDFSLLANARREGVDAAVPANENPDQGAARRFIATLTEETRGIRDAP